jgi:glycosyltransferase involved in cell wall biosynthesis
VLWTIAICGIPDRFHTVSPLLYSLLETQGVARHPDVELLYLLDSKRRTTGAKRNTLLNAARGDYISFIDDDDAVAGDYVARVLDALRQHPGVDVVCFPQRATLAPMGLIHECTYSLAHKTRELKPTAQPNVFTWTGPPAHTMVWRMGVVGASRFPEQQFGEDVAWVDEVCARAKREAQIEGPPAYFYQFDSERSATRG